MIAPIFSGYLADRLHFKACFTIYGGFQIALIIVFQLLPPDKDSWVLIGLDGAIIFVSSGFKPII